MLRGELVTLRAKREADKDTLKTLDEDVELSSRTSSKPWRPVAPSREPNDKYDDFTVVTAAGDDIAGEASLWGIDTHNRQAHIGITLLPDFRGKGLGTDVVRVLCHYGFVVRGLHRLQLETLADNVGMIRTAARVGFTREGVLRRSGWVMGEFIDECLFGMLVEEWTEQSAGA